MPSIANCLRGGMSDEPEVLFSRDGAAGIVTLNRPKALNALTLGMVRAIHPQLMAWAADEAVEVIVVKGAGEKAFCAGGDIRALHDWGKVGDREVIGFLIERGSCRERVCKYVWISVVGVTK